MQGFLAFWWLCCRRAARGASAFANDWQWVFGTPTLAFIIFLYNKRYGEGAMTLSQDVAGAFFAATAAFFLTWVVKFVAGLVKAPADLYRESQGRNRAMQSAIREAMDVRALVPRLIEMRDQGRAIYFRKLNPTQAETVQWRADLEIWKGKVEAELRDHWTESELHMFMAANGFSEYTRDYPDDWQEWYAENKDTLRLYTSKISELNELISRGPQRVLPAKMALSAALEMGNEQKGLDNVTRQAS